MTERRSDAVPAAVVADTGTATLDAAPIGGGLNVGTDTAVPPWRTAAVVDGEF